MQHEWKVQMRLNTVQKVIFHICWTVQWKKVRRSRKFIEGTHERVFKEVNLCQMSCEKNYGCI